jgi:hypothetical protein
LARFSQLHRRSNRHQEQAMKRRKHGSPPTGHVSKGAHRATKHPASDDIVALLAEQAARTEIKQKLLEAQQRRGGKAQSKQPPLSDEMKDVTEIGGLRWKLGRTK